MSPQARRANAVHEPVKLVPLCLLAREMIVHVSAQARDNLSRAADSPWRILNFNYAIIATRSQEPELMNAAYDLLERNLPGDCSAFFEEGVRQAEKKVYDPHVREIVRQRLAKWTVRH